MAKKTTPNYDNTLVGRYIRQIENPDSAGWNPSSRIWVAPSSKGYDPNNRGMGVDVIYNETARQMTEGRPGRYLTEEEERQLRNKHIDYSLGALRRNMEKKTGVKKLSPRKEAETVGLIYRGDANEIWDGNTKLGKAFRSGNDEEFHNAVEEYYQSKKLNERARNNDSFWEQNKEPSPHKGIFARHLNQWDALKYKYGIKAYGGPIVQQANMFKGGGPKKKLSDKEYYSIMERVAQENNPIWNKDRIRRGEKPLSVNEEYLRILNDNSYDYRGFYNNNSVDAANASTHWPDDYKTVYHPTFSIYSKHSGKVSDFNPLGLEGGRWPEGPVEAEEKDFQPAWWQSIPNTYTGRWQYENGGQLNSYKQWQDLPIKERADIMKVAIRNGITNLADIKAKYNEFALGGNMTSNESANLYGRGSQMNRGAWRTQHQRRWYSFLKRKGLNNSDASRLSGFFAAQDGFESAGGTSSAARQKNNFGGMQRGGKNISYPSVEAYMEDKWNMMNSKFRSALGARSIDEYATILGNPNTAGKGYLYYVTDQAKYDPQSPAWRAAQTKRMHNYINGMRSWAGQGAVKFGNDDYSYNQSNWPQGYVYDVLPQLFAMDGVPITVSSGYRPGAVVKGTNRASRHGMHQAADIVGDFAKIQQVLDNPNSNVSRWMLANGYGYLNETSGPGGTTKHWKDHNRDHSHYHIGMDSSLAQQYAARFSGMSLQPQSDNNTFLAFEPSNPQAFFAPLSSYETPVEQTPTQPLVDVAEQQYKAEMAERQRIMQQNNNMLALVSYLNNSGSQDSSPFGVFNLLSGSQIEV